MKIVTLMEDTPGNHICGYEHGLSLYLETEKHRILFDTGASAMTIENASKLNIDLQKVDTVIISHGHYDHAGGLLAFCQQNSHAKIYLQNHAGDDYFHGLKYIGIDKRIMTLPQLKIIKGNKQIDHELFLFSHIKGRKMFADSNRELSKRINGQNIEDQFEHEQCLAVFTNGKKILLSGCAHNGIINILDRYRELFGSNPDIVISGFHLQKKTDYSQQEIKNINALAQELLKTGATFYTGHCTGKVAFDMMKMIMNDRLIYIHSGDWII